VSPLPQRCAVNGELILSRAILEGLKHRNIVQLVQKIKDVKNERIYIVMEVSVLLRLLHGLSFLFPLGYN
jgi:hypothetical protein